MLNASQLNHINFHFNVLCHRCVRVMMNIINLYKYRCPVNNRILSRNYKKIKTNQEKLYQIEIASLIWKIWENFPSSKHIYLFLCVWMSVSPCQATKKVNLVFLCWVCVSIPGVTNKLTTSAILNPFCQLKTHFVNPIKPCPTLSPSILTNVIFLAHDWSFCSKYSPPIGRELPLHHDMTFSLGAVIIFFVHGWIIVQKD